MYLRTLPLSRKSFVGPLDAAYKIPMIRTVRLMNLHNHTSLKPQFHFAADRKCLQIYLTGNPRTIFYHSLAKAR